MELSKYLNEQQLKAVQCTDGPLLLLAGAGSGKTRVITYRIAHIIKAKGVPPESIMALTFTNKAAEEMKARVLELLGSSARKIWISTFHSACTRILRREALHLGISSKFVIYDSADQLSLVKQCCNDLNISSELYAPKKILEHISRLKNDLITPADYQQTARSYGFEAVALGVYKEYESRLRAYEALDFDDLLSRTVWLMENNNDVLSFYQKFWRYILVDEYQDTNRAQYRLLKLLAQKHQNICVVGDDDQSIYRWRGADLNNILDFEKDYPTSRVMKLEENYRSTQTILKAAGEMISHNMGRKGKTLWTQRETGEQIGYYRAEDELNEANFLCKTAKSLLPAGYSLSDMAVFYRTNAQSRVIEDALRKENIPYRVLKGLRFYDRKEIKDALAYLRVIVNPHDSLSLKRIINIPPRGIGAVSLNKLELLAQQTGKSLFETIFAIKEQPDNKNVLKHKLEEFINLFTDWQRLAQDSSASRVLAAVLEKTDYLGFLKNLKNADGESKIENVKELVSAVAEFEKKSENKSLSAYLDLVALYSEQDELDERSGFLSLMTLHASKGLEFAIVFVIGMENNLFPHARSLGNGAELEEERRLCYVGMTRAKDKLYLLNARVRKIFGQELRNSPSLFLEEIPDQFIAILNHYDSPRSYSENFCRDNAQEHPDHGETGPSTRKAFEKRPLRRTNPDTVETTENKFIKGVMVMHPKFGQGIIQKQEGQGNDLKVTVIFKQAGIKTLLVKYANLKALSS